MIRRVDVPPQRVYGSVPLLLPLVKMSDAEATKMDGEPQIYDRDYPLDYDGLGFNPSWASNTGLGDLASFGNVAMLPHEVAQMSGLGLTPAQQAAQAKRQAAQAAAAAKKAAATAQRQATQQAAAQKKAAAAQKPVTKAVKTAAPPNTNTAAGCRATGGTWTAQGKICTPAGQTPPPTAAQQRANSKLQAQCQKTGGTWDATNNKCISASDQAQQQCTAAGNYWNGTACITQTQQACVQAGNTWDPTNGVCITNPNAPKPCPTIQPVCGPGQIIGNDTNGCPVICVPDPNYQNPAIAQCQQTGGYWNGTYCTPPAGLNYPPPPPGGGGGDLAPIPPGYGDPSGGMSPPMPGGGGFPMTPGAPPGSQSDLLNQSAGDYAPSADQSDQSGDQTDQSGDTSQTSDGSDSSGDGTTGDASQVAQGGILDSISKFFSGMNGLACGCNAPPPWIDMGGGNLSGTFPEPSFATAKPLAPVKQSTTAGVVIGSVVLIAAAAAIFLWSKGGKK